MRQHLVQQSRPWEKAPTYKPMSHLHPSPPHNPNASAKRQLPQARDRVKHTFPNGSDWTDHLRVNRPVENVSTERASGHLKAEAGRQGCRKPR
jgi:hypothetical protein